MNREPIPPTEFNRLSKLLAGCADPGGVLPMQVGLPADTVGGRIPKVTHLVVPPTLSVSDLAAALGLKLYVIIGELIKLDMFTNPATPLDFATMHRLCAQLGVSVQPADDCIEDND